MGTSPGVADAWHYCSLFSPVIALGLNVAAQVRFVRARGGAQFLRSITQGCLVGAGALVVFEALLLAWRGISGDSVAFSLLVNAPTYAALSVCYFALANLGHTSIRVRLYAELLASPDGMSVRDIERRYAPEAFMAVRLQRLRDGGDLVEKNDGFIVARKRLLYFAHLMVAAKVLLFGRRSQFD